jgi:hypothetical protein
MPAHCMTQDQIADYKRDLRKHEPRPGDRLRPTISSAMEIAITVRNLTDIQQAAALIQQYADTAKAEGRLDGTVEAFERMERAMEQG